MEHNKSIIDRYSREEKLGFDQRLRFEFSLLQLDDLERGPQNEKPPLWSLREYQGYCDFEASG